MSLEAAIQANIQAIHALIEAIKTIPSATVELRAEPAATGKPLTAAQAEAALFNQHGKAAETPAATPAATPAPAPAAEKPKATKPAAEKPAQAPAPAPAADAPTFEQVRDAIFALSKSKGREPVVVLLQRLGASKVPDIKPEAYAEALALVARANAGEDLAAALQGAE